jgi:hypothetical protein
MTLFKTIYDITTGETIEQDLTPDEIAELEASEAKLEAKVKEEEAKEAGRQAVFNKLGLTAEDIAALGL